MFAQFSYSVEVYRIKVAGGARRRDAWGNLLDLSKDSVKDVPSLLGRAYSHTIDNVVIAPRTTGDEKSSAYNAKLGYTGKTMFVPAGSDIHQDDYIKYIDEAGKIQVYRIEGEGDTNLFVSPFSSYEGGVEVNLQRVVEVA